jgi:hypothetical protein
MHLRGHILCQSEVTVPQHRGWDLGSLSSELPVRGPSGASHKAHTYLRSALRQQSRRATREARGAPRSSLAQCQEE